MLCFAKDECRRLEKPKIVLSTSKLQPAAVSLYQSAGYRLLREDIAVAASNKTIGGGIRRFYFEKMLTLGDLATIKAPQCAARTLE